MVGYGFVVGQQIVPGENVQINGTTTVDQQFSFSKLPMYAQIPQDAQIVFIVQGMIEGNQMAVNLGFMDFYQKVGQGWKDFWTLDTFKPYTINFLYGPKMFGKSANSLFYWVFVIGVVILLFKF